MKLIVSSLQIAMVLTFKNEHDESEEERWDNNNKNGPKSPSLVDEDDEDVFDARQRSTSFLVSELSNCD